MKESILSLGFLMIQQSLVTSQDDSVHPFHMTELPLDDKTDPVDVSHLDDSMRRGTGHRLDMQKFSKRMLCPFICYCNL